MVTFIEALLIAQQKTGVLDLELRTNVENLGIYRLWDDDCWVFNLPVDVTHGIKDMEVILISKQTGNVLYYGSAKDEG
ncbi:MAG: hypothetical protein LAT67_11510 [Balneolales bacterium]|nr:hypothetical protein [Balneolales bacterium]